jgi:hypothetical protein
MRTIVALIALILLGSFSAAEQPCPPLAFELSRECMVHRGLTEKLELFEQKIALAKRLYQLDAEVRVHVFGSIVYSKFSGTTDDAFSMPETDSRLRPVSHDVYVRWTMLERGSELLLEHIALHEVAHFLNGDIAGYRPNGGNTEAACENRVLSVVGEAKYREYIREYFEKYRPKKIDYDAFIDLVRAAKPRIESE